MEKMTMAEFNTLSPRDFEDEAVQDGIALALLENKRTIAELGDEVKHLRAMMRNGMRLGIILRPVPEDQEARNRLYEDIKYEAERLAGQISTPCCECGGPVVEFSVTNEVWDVIVRGGGAETDREYLCIDCFLRIALELPKSPRQRKGKNDETG